MKTSLEDLSARARRGQLGDNEVRELERLLEASLEARLAHRAGLEFDREDSVLVGDDALAESINQRLISPPPRATAGRRRVVALIVGGVCTAMAAAAGPALVREFSRAWPSFAGAGAPAQASAPPTLVSRNPASRHAGRPWEAPGPRPIPAEQPVIAEEQTIGNEPTFEQKHAERERLWRGKQAPSARRTDDLGGPQQKSPPLESSAALFTEASLMRRQGQSGRAIQLYAQLLERYPRSGEAGSAQIALAMLHLGSGAASSALTYFNRYLAEHPGGQLAAEAWWGKTRALTALGRDEEARRSLLLLVKRYPRSTYATAARAKLGSPLP